MKDHSLPDPVTFFFLSNNRTVFKGSSDYLVLITEKKIKKNRKTHRHCEHYHHCSTHPKNNLTVNNTYVTTLKLLLVGLNFCAFEILMSIFLKTAEKGPRNYEEI